MLEKQVDNARKEIVSDGYEMSIGEIINIYKDGELNISPEYQRLFRWTTHQKTRFIETLMLGLPIPPIFVFQTDDGRWELIDGLQRLSTILEFIGSLPGYEPSSLNGTNYLPALAGKYWEPHPPSTKNGIGTSLQIQIKRQRIRVEILKKESDNNAKYELFQRLNTGGTKLSEQEIRHCVVVMLNQTAASLMTRLAQNVDFKAVTCLTEDQVAKKFDEELVLRYFAIANIDYQNGLDVHDFLDEAAKLFCAMPSSKQTTFAKQFTELFQRINNASGRNAFRLTPTGRSGQFQLGKFETIISGISHNWKHIKSKDDVWLGGKISKLPLDPDFIKNSGAGIRGTTRFANLIPLGKKFFAK